MIIKLVQRANGREKKIHDTDCREENLPVKSLTFSSAYPVTVDNPYLSGEVGKKLNFDKRKIMGGYFMQKSIFVFNLQCD